MVEEKRLNENSLQRSGCFEFVTIDETEDYDYIQYRTARLVGHSRVFAAIAVEFTEGSDWKVKFYYLPTDTHPILEMSLGQCYNIVMLSELDGEIDYLNSKIEEIESDLAMTKLK